MLTQFQSNQTMQNKDLLEIINSVRIEMGEPVIRLNKFNEKIEDELEGEHYTKSVVKNPNGTESVVYELTLDQCMLISMREAAKELQIGQNKLTQYLLDHKVVYRDQSSKIQAYQKSIDSKLVRVVTSAPRMFETGEKVFTQVKLTQKLITRIATWLEKGAVA